MKAGFAAVVLAIALVSMSGWAQPSGRSDTAELAQKQIDSGEFEDAVQTLERGLEQDLTDDQLAELYRLLGLASLYLEREDRAVEAYEKLLQARPDYELPKTTPPKIRTIYARIKDDLRKRKVKPVTLALDFPATLPTGQAARFSAALDNLALGSQTRLYYRRAGQQRFSSVDFVRNKKDKRTYEATIPAFDLPVADETYEIQYYLEVTDAVKRRLAGKGDAQSPLVFRMLSAEVEPEAPKPIPWYRHPAFLIGAGVVVAGATATTIILVTQRQSGSLPITIQIEGVP